jgi:hypothetical protein
MALVVRKDDVVVKLINLGYATLDGNEYDRVRTLAEKYGANVQLEVLDLEQVHDFATVFSEVEKAIK